MSCPEKARPRARLAAIAVLAAMLLALPALAYLTATSSIAHSFEVGVPVVEKIEAEAPTEEATEPLIDKASLNVVAIMSDGTTYALSPDEFEVAPDTIPIGTVGDFQVIVTYYADGQAHTAPVTLKANLPHPKQTFAVYSASDSSLTFYDRGDLPSVGSIYQGKTVSKVYTGFGEKAWTTATEIPWYPQRTLFKTVIFADTIKPAESFGFFFEMSNLESISNLERLDISASSNANGMFKGCAKLKELDVPEWRIAPKRINSMFSGCTSLAYINAETWNMLDCVDATLAFKGCKSMRILDMSGWETPSLELCHSMFHCCTSLETVYAGAGWTMDGVPRQNSEFMFGSVSLTETEPMNLVGGNGTRYADADVVERTFNTYARIDKPGQPGFFTDKSLPRKTAFAVYSADDASLTFYKRADVPVEGASYQGKRASKVYTGIESTPFTKVTEIPWYGVRQEVRSVTVADEVQPSYVTGYFMGMDNLATISGLERLDTSASANVISMFNGCSKLTRLDAPYLVRASHVSMSSIFNGCSSLETIGGMDTWATNSIENAGFAFYGCKALRVLDQSSWSTPSLKVINSMYYFCSSLETVYVGPGWCKDGVSDGELVFGAYSVGASPTLLVGGNGTAFEAAYTFASYNFGLDLAQADLPGQLGLFTLKA